MSSSSPSPNTNWFSDKMNRFHDGHERLKHSVHSYWRQNNILSPRGKVGKVVMGCLYFSIPVVVGYFVVTKVVDRSESTIQERLGGIGSVTSTSNSNSTSSNRQSSDANNAETETTPSSSSSTEKVGAGGWGGGVHLATGDKQTQDVNRINLERFMKKQRRLKEKRERKAKAAAAAQE